MLVLLNPVEQFDHLKKINIRYNLLDNKLIEKINHLNAKKFHLIIEFTKHES